MAAASVDVTDEILRSGVQDVAAAVAVGRQYLDSQPQAMAEVEAFLQDVFQQFARSKQGADKNSFRCSLKAQINQDLSNDDIVWVDGWLVSRTEAVFSAALAHSRLKIL